ncbi:MAG: nodulation protein NodH [Roseinatronobacter sp.]
MSLPRKFASFVVLAEMRTGSNLLEACLNSFDALRCEGEAFNPVFLGHPATEALFGIDRATRDRDPLALLAAFAQQPVLSGFRYFHDHDPRILHPMLRDPACAKIILTRNPLESYVSLQIARATQQWRLGDVKFRRTEKVRFDPVQFEAHVRTLQAFQLEVQNTLQITGQTAFYLDYEDLQSLDVINGLARWLGVAGQIDSFPRKLKRQNPEPPEEKLLNPDALADGIARLDRFHLSRSPSFEPRQPALMWAYTACRSVPLVFVPMPGLRHRAVRDWMAEIDSSDQDGLLVDFSSRDWRDWQRANPARVAFTLIHHPLARAHAVFQTEIALGPRENVRDFIARVHGITLPDTAEGLAALPRETHRAGFLAYLSFTRANLNGQTALGPRPIWASQSRLIEGISARCPLHHLIRVEHAPQDLPRLGRALGRQFPAFAGLQTRLPLDLGAIHDPEVEAEGRAAYGRDYELLGFGDWRAG